MEVVPGGIDELRTTQEQDCELPDFNPEEHKYADSELDDMEEEAEGSQVINEDSIIIKDDPAEKLVTVDLPTGTNIETDKRCLQGTSVKRCDV